MNPEERNVILEEAARFVEQRIGDAFLLAEELRALKTTPAPAAESDWFAGDVDCDGNELVTIRADELQKLRDEREKFMWQVRDTCTRAEKAEAALAATPAVSTDEIAVALVEAAIPLEALLLSKHRQQHSAELWAQIESAAQGARAILSRLRGEEFAT